MAWAALTCPQCSAPLPRVALWRAVKCSSCGALITKSESMVLRDSFRQALVRSRQDPSGAGGDIVCGSESYQLIQLLGKGEISEVHLARRLGALPFMATVKLSSAPSAASHYAREAQALRDLHGSQTGAASAYCSQYLPVVVTQGKVEGDGSHQALVMRHAEGYWGSLAALSERFPKGLDPRHSVWIWRRMLDMLHFIHAQGWSHGDVRPEHALVHPGNHAVRLIGWASAQKGASRDDQVKDLQRSARVILVLLSGTNDSGDVPTQVPDALAQLVTQASQDEKFCDQHGAAGLDAKLRAAAQSAFGPPTFVPLTV